MANMQTITWVCRSCGLVNGLQSRACTSCSQVRNSGASLQDILGGGMVAQVLNPGAETVFNNVYNFAAGPPPNLMNVHGSPSAGDDEEEVRLVSPSPSYARPFIHGLLKAVTVMSLMVICLILLFFCIVVVMAITKAMGRW